jgi:hypothetical protein
MHDHIVTKLISLMKVVLHLHVYMHDHIVTKLIFLMNVGTKKIVKRQRQRYRDMHIRRHVAYCRSLLF